MAHWTYFLLAIVWGFSLQIESKCKTTHLIGGQAVTLFENTLDSEQSCVKVGECVIGWKSVRKNDQDIVEYEAAAKTYGYIAVGLNNRANWNLADTVIVSRSTAANLHSVDCVNAAEDSFRPVLDTDGQNVDLGDIRQNQALRIVSFARPKYPSSSEDRAIEIGTYLLCTFGPETDLNNLAALTPGDVNQLITSNIWNGQNGSSALSASSILLLLVTTMAAYLNIK